MMPSTINLPDPVSDTAPWLYSRTGTNSTTFQRNSIIFNTKNTFLDHDIEVDIQTNTGTVTPGIQTDLINVYATTQGASSTTYSFKLTPISIQSSGFIETRTAGDPYVNNTDAQYYLINNGTLTSNAGVNLNTSNGSNNSTTNVSGIIKTNSVTTTEPSSNGTYYLSFTGSSTSTVTANGWLTSADNTTTSTTKYFPVTTASISVTAQSGGAVTSSISITGNTNVTLSDDSTVSGIAVEAQNSSTATVTAQANVTSHGYAPEKNNYSNVQINLAETTTSTTKYITGVTVGSEKTFSVKNSGTTTITSSGTLNVTSTASTINSAVMTITSNGKVTLVNIGTTTFTSSGTSTITNSGTAAITSSGAATVTSTGKITVTSSSTAAYTITSGTATITNSGTATITNKNKLTVTNDSVTGVQVNNTSTTGVVKVNSSGITTVTNNGTLTVTNNANETANITNSGTLSVTNTSTLKVMNTGTISVTSTSGTITINQTNSASGNVTVKAQLKSDNSTSLNLAPAAIVVNGRIQDVVPNATGGELTNTATITPTSVAITTSPGNYQNGIALQAVYATTRAAVKYSSATSGWIIATANQQVLAATTASGNGALYYITSVTIPIQRKLTVEMTASSTTSEMTNNNYALTLNVRRHRKAIITNVGGYIGIGHGSSNTGVVWITAKGDSTSYNLISGGTWTTTSVTPSPTNAITITGVGKVTVNSITAGAMSAVTTDPGDTYYNNTAVVLSPDGWLKINAGYYNDTKISLATLVPDSANVVAVSGTSNQILSGVTVYDNDGKLITGTIETYSGTAVVYEGGITA